MVKTGYFASHKRPLQFNKVHAVHRDRPICNTWVSLDSVFQWCAHGIHIEYINCKRCLKLLEGKVICPSCGHLFS